VGKESNVSVHGLSYANELVKRFMRISY
jgi:hypothetical protein